MSHVVPRDDAGSATIVGVRNAKTLVMVLALVACATLPAAARANFQLGLQDYGMTEPASAPDLARAYRALHEFNGTTVRLILPWQSIGPAGKRKPAGFNASDPADPRYMNWTYFDGWVRNAARHHAQVMLTILGAPEWALTPNPPSYIRQVRGAWEPSPSELGAFAHAAALRYSGRFHDPSDPKSFLPHVKYWEVWNEENLPQDLGARHVVDWYRSMLNAAYAGIKRVDGHDVVVLGGFAPVSFETGSMSPLRFAAQLMCLRRAGTRFVRARRCPVRAYFDIFAMHPYTLAATPTKHAYHYDDVLIGDMGKVGALVRAADRLHTVGPRAHHPIWVTEWSWITNPPNNVVGDSWASAARYVAYAMYEMWRAGTSMVIWFLVQDPNVKNINTPQFALGSGFYDKLGTAKPMLRSFEFPVVAMVQHGRGFVWGRAPVSGKARIVVQRLVRRRWVPLISILTAGDGTFVARFRAFHNGLYRAQLTTGLTSLAYDSRPIPPKRTHLIYTG